jgi:phytoene synthase
VSVEACAGIVRQGDPDRFLATLTAPRALRPNLMVLYAFNLEVARAPWVTREPMIAEMRLQFWVDTLDSIAAGAPPRAHEVAEPLAALVRDTGLKVDLLRDLVEARFFDIGPDGHTGPAAFETYLDRTSGNLLMAALEASGLPTTGAAEAGRAFGLAALLRAVPALVASGRQPLVDPASEAIAAMAREGLARLAEARRLAPRHAASVLRAGWLTGALLDQAAKDPEAVLDGRLGVSEAFRRGSLLWKTAVGGW